MVEMASFNIYNVQRAVTPKAGYPELWLLCSARYLMVLYICERFHENILNSFQLTERTGTYVARHNDGDIVNASVCP